MAAKKPATTPKAAEVVADEPSPFPKGYSGPTSGVMAPGPIGKAARAAAHTQGTNGGAPNIPTPDRPRDR